MSERGIDIDKMTFGGNGSKTVVVPAEKLTRDLLRELFGQEPIVRCRRSRYLRTDTDGGKTAHFCGNLETGFTMIPLRAGLDFFCAFGELRK